jgi:hypothetical protein
VPVRAVLSHALPPRPSPPPTLQVKNQCEAFQEQNQHLVEARGQVEAELVAQRENVEKMAARLKKLVTGFQAKADVPEEERDLQAISFDTQVGGRRGRSMDLHDVGLKARFWRASLKVLRHSTTTLLYTVGELVREFPEVAGFVQSHLQKANLVLPSRPPNRPASARSEASEKSDRSNGSRKSSASSRSIPVKSFAFGM